MAVGLRLTLGALAGLWVAALIIACAMASVGFFAAAVYLMLRVHGSGAWAAAWVGAGLLALAAGMLGLGWLVATRPSPRRRSSRALAEFAAREPLAASVLALAAGVGAGRSPALRQLLRELLDEM